MQKQGKYKAQKTKRGKLTFDSKKEAERYDAVPQSVRVCYTGGVTWSAQTSR
nr:MAG TPA: YebG protein [Caudoviricetes sp.]